MSMTKTALGVSNVRLTNLKKLTSVVLFFAFLTSGLQASAKNLGEGEKITATYADTTIRGRVVDSLNAPLVGVSVLVKGTQNGTVTNATGDFILNNVPANATLVISTVGYQP